VFNFTEGWLCAVNVGVAAGIVLWERDAANAGTAATIGKT
jgi:hypothetical protein